MASRVSARRRRRESTRTDSAGPVDLLVHRCRTLVRSGDHRRAVKALRQLADRDQSPGAWVRLGVELARAGRLDDALDALGRGRFLHRRAGSRRRADVVSALIEQLRSNEFPLAA